MSSYEGFSKVYDKFMSDTPYDRWTDYIKELWDKYSISPSLLAELGCGTGNITQRLANMGYDMIGIDISEQMLCIAEQKAVSAGKRILYLNQDMREFELYGTVDCIISLCDSMNYITDKEDLLCVFKLINNYLNPEGLFIFDLNTIYKFKNILGNRSFSCTEENAAYVWENYFDENENINEYYTTFFVKDEKSGLYERFDEEHCEKGYTINEIKETIEKAGLKFEAVFDDSSFLPPKEDSQRIFFVAREKGKKKGI